MATRVPWEIKQPQIQIVAKFTCITQAMLLSSVTLKLNPRAAQTRIVRILLSGNFPVSRTKLRKTSRQRTSQISNYRKNIKQLQDWNAIAKNECILYWIRLASPNILTLSHRARRSRAV
ncbi:hypothetical protein AVEN_80432-1 [Araneus ventricosus]|uniref:Uncharacterized protein n=1 Tax=Araneus ventricosus TaxID=182803 RepID=A0A4Y2H466_ARAVE|nr:hypothetical protein AVEN_80432-1 [Araneus ventricosus]